MKQSAGTRSDIAMAGPQIIAERGLRKNEIAMRRTAPMTAGSLEDLTDFIRQALTKCKETGMEPPFIMCAASFCWRAS
jgi:hypothetical protein